MDANDMRQKRAALLTEARSILAAENVSAEDEKRADALMGEADEWEAKIKREDSLRDRERREAGTRENIAKRELRPAVGDSPDLRSSKEYREAFFSQYVRTGASTPELRVLSEGTGAAGGYLLPTETEREVVQQLRNVTVMRGLAKVMTTTSTIDIPIVSSHGSAAWVAESGAYTASDEVFSQIVLKAWKAGTMILVPEELLFDSIIDLEAYIVAEFVERIAHLEDAAFVNGDGTSKPRGFVLDAQTGVTGATGNTTTIANASVVYDIYHSLPRYYRQRAAWVMPDTYVKQIRKFQATTGQFIWQPGLMAGQPDTLLGRPVVVTDDMPVPAANATSLGFGDFSYYRIADRGSRSMQRLNERYADVGQIGFKAYERVDGALTKAEAVQLYKNSAT